jgi:hypothetical protein
MRESNSLLIWREEQEKLVELANSVPDNGTIVEIGTALGGTATIFNNSTIGRRIKIYTIDTVPFQRAYDNLKNTDVIIVNKSSVEYAHMWKQEVDRTIDLLFIDADHNFQSVFNDFHSWIPFMKPKGTIVFHDYDPVERGGLAHFGIRVFLDTLIEHNLLNNIKHEYKLLHGRVKNENIKSLNVNDYFKTFSDIGKQITNLRTKIFADSIKSGIQIIKERSIDFDSLQACYCIDYALRKDFEYLDIQTQSFHDFRKWTEMSSILEHACDQSPFPDNIYRIPIPTNVGGLSQFIAKEQLRITFLTLILKTIVDWEP